MSDLVPSVTAVQQFVLEAIYGAFRETRDWPSFDHVDRALDRQSRGDLSEVLNSLSDLYGPLRAGGVQWYQPDEKLHLRLRGLACCRGAEEDLRLFVATVQWIVQLWWQRGDLPSPQAHEPIHRTAQDLAEVLAHELGHDPALYQVELMLELMRNEPFMPNPGGPVDNRLQWSFEITRDIRRFSEVSSVETLGSVADLTSSSGASEWTYAYDPYGGIFTQTKNDPNAPANPMLFAGELQDSTELYYLRARPYDPASGRLLQADPMGSNVGSPLQSLYAYVDDQPTVMIDPSGAMLTAADDGLNAAEAVTSGGGCPIGVGPSCERLGINRSRVVWYLLRYALSTNPKYGRVNNDCTSFISQALHWGGWAEDDTWNFHREPVCAIDPYTGIGGCPDYAGTRPVPSLAWDNVKAFVRYTTGSGRDSLSPNMSS